MRKVSRKYQVKQKLARRRLSKRNLLKKKYGGSPLDDEETENYLTEIMRSASEQGKNFVDNEEGYRQYWLKQVIPSMRAYVETQNNNNKLTNAFYQDFHQSMNDLEQTI